MRPRIVALLAAAVAATSLFAQRTVYADAPVPASTTSDKILLSIPDAGGLRIAVKPNNNLHIHVAGKDLPGDVPTTSIVRRLLLRSVGRGQCGRAARRRCGTAHGSQGRLPARVYFPVGGPYLAQWRGLRRRCHREERNAGPADDRDDPLTITGVNLAPGATTALHFTFQIPQAIAVQQVKLREKDSRVYVLTPGVK